MRKLTLWVITIAAASAAVTTTGSRSQAGVIAPLGLREAADDLLLTETVQFTWGGRRYCWYNAGWRGPAGTSVAFVCGAASAGVARPGGTDGDGQVAL